MIEIFSRYNKLRFVKLKNKSKAPFESNWQDKPYTYDEILKHYNSGQNYGLLCWYGDLLIIDCDKVTSSNDKNQKYPELDEKLSEVISKNLPETFEVQSGSGAKHYYFFCKGLSKKIILKSKYENNEVHWGEILSKGSQGVGPGSIHPETGNKYKVLNNNKIAKISLIQLYKALRNFIPSLEEKKDYSINEINNYAIDDLKVENIFGTSSLNKQSGQFVGSHPIHGSQGGSNFWIDPSKNTWFCFRCQSGGGPASAIAVKHGIINCSDASRGQLKGELFMKTISIAKEQYGLKHEIMKPAESFEVISKTNDLKLNLWTFQDFENFEIDNHFLVNKIIYPKTLTMLYSPPGEFKSIMSLYMALAIAQGKPWIGYETEQNAVLYCDKENNDKIIKERMMAIYKGENYNDKTMPLYVLRREGELITNKRANSDFIKKLFYTIEEHNIKVVFFDTMHRFGDYDENSSDDVNLLYTQVFQPLMEKYECSVIFLHHTTKEGKFRGSGDFLGMVDTAYSVKRGRAVEGKKSNCFKIINEKNRSGEVESMNAEIEFITKKDGDIELLDKIEIITSDKDSNKSTNFTQVAQVVRSSLKPGELKTRKDFAQALEDNFVETSESTLKRVLRWLIDKETFIRDDRNRYKLAIIDEVWKNG